MGKKKDTTQREEDQKRNREWRQDRQKWKWQGRDMKRNWISEAMLGLDGAEMRQINLYESWRNEK